MNKKCVQFSADKLQGSKAGCVWQRVLSILVALGGIISHVRAVFGTAESNIDMTANNLGLLKI